MLTRCRCVTMRKRNTRIVVHLQDSLENDYDSCLVGTVDTDVVIIFIGKYHSLYTRYPSADLWMASGTGKRFVFQIYRNEMLWAVPLLTTFFPDVIEICFPPAKSVELISSEKDWNSFFAGVTQKNWPIALVSLATFLRTPFPLFSLVNSLILLTILCHRQHQLVYTIRAASWCVGQTPYLHSRQMW